MRFCSFHLAVICLGTRLASAQQIFDVWTTTEDKSQLLQYKAQDPPINFDTSAKSGAATISVDDSSVSQIIHGFGATLTDSAATTLNGLKSSNAGNYNTLLNKLFDATDANFENAGLSYLRIPLGASDFSASIYSYDDTEGDTSLSKFTIDAAPSEVFSVVSDIMAINSAIKVHFVPWSPPGWMKDSGSMKGGSLKTEFIDTYANYILKALQGWQSKGVTAFAVSIQNEPENGDTTYPTATMAADLEAKVATSLRSLLDTNGFTATKIIGYEHNWIDAANYPVQVVDNSPNVFAGASFHCYAGTVDQQGSFISAHPNKEVYFTECAGTIGSDFWSDLKFNMDNIILGSQEHGSSSGLFWSLAGDASGGPILPGTDSCAGAGCRPVVTVNADGSYVLNTEFFAAAHASKATIPKDNGGPVAKRVASTVDTGLLRVGAYVTGRANSADFLRYSLVVMNWNDAGAGTPMDTVIKFRGSQAQYTFPVGVTTLTWYAAPDGAPSRRSSTVHRRHHQQRRRHV
ncbi:glycoside hydrolase [Punctularia strigosozonata HHB-11173 SS5]|uniref:glycoside hydrolase n=1 Tax=Punctularia strigosozonata (strain HHB-11173) TaxID=741275 RepID=UPI0004417288|nr:glycoside hydrolase [Punctularia strigosozonata HHB-11173 SS5]EIN08490.1 glycoside hydrolase [Punctularia strigosozonata HHB-11173 SS5]